MVMAMSTQTLREAARLFEQNILLDMVQIYDVSEPVTVGIEVVRPLIAVGQPVPGLMQSTSLETAMDGRVMQSYAVKVGQGTPLRAGQAVRLLSSRTEPALVGKLVLIDRVSENSLGTIRKGVATDFTMVNQEGKEGLA